VAGRDEKQMPGGKMAEPERGRRRTVDEMPHGEMEEPGARAVRKEAAKKPKAAAKKGGRK